MEELCYELGIPFREAELTVADCLKAEEAFITSTPYCMAPVRQLGVEHVVRLEVAMDDPGQTGGLEPEGDLVGELARGRRRDLAVTA